MRYEKGILSDRLGLLVDVGSKCTESGVRHAAQKIICRVRVTAGEQTEMSQEDTEK
jgi:hypothetical protein